MSTPEEPFDPLRPAQTPPAGYGAPLGYGPPAGYGAPPGYGPPAGYGAPPGYGPPAGYSPPAGYGPVFGRGGLPELASWGQRVAASLLDGLVLFGVIFLAALLGLLLRSVSVPLGTLVIVLGYLAGLGVFVWQLVVQGRTGQTIGKRAVGLRLLREQDGQVIGAGLSVARYFVHLLDSYSIVGYLWPIWDDKKQTFADKILKTVVVRT